MFKGNPCFRERVGRQKPNSSVVWGVKELSLLSSTLPTLGWSSTWCGWSFLLLSPPRMSRYQLSNMKHQLFSCNLSKQIREVGSFMVEFSKLQSSHNPLWHYSFFLINEINVTKKTFPLDNFNFVNQRVKVLIHLLQMNLCSSTGAEENYQRTQL